MIDTQFDGMIVGRIHLGRLTGADLLAADDQGHLDLLRLHRLQGFLERGFFRAALAVGQDRLIARFRDLKIGIGHGGSSGNKS